jgi:hypothetical protein
MAEQKEFDKGRAERLVAEDVQQVVWLRFRRLTSPRLCRRIVEARAPGLPKEVAEKKAEGVASAVRSALGYWESTPASLNAKILMRYYALLQVTIAEQVASPEAGSDLTEIQRHTEFGHGLATFSREDLPFPQSLLIAPLRSGHFFQYCQYRDLDIDRYSFERRPKQWKDLSSDEQDKVVSLADVFRRIPELQPLIEECLGGSPLSFHVGHASKNFEVRSARTRQHIEKTGAFTLAAPPDGPTTITYAAIYPHSSIVTKEYLDTLGLPFRNIHEEADRHSGLQYFVGELEHPSADLWWNHFKTYKSGYCGTSIIVPLWGIIDDPFIMHFLALYALSIVVRYLPSRWHEIEDGPLDHIRALIEHYLAIVDAVLPRLSVERITNAKLRVVSPEGMNAPA